MSKIYEALLYAYKKKGKSDFPPFPVAYEPDSVEVGEIAELEMREEMLCLYKMLDSLLPDAKSKVIQFIGARSGEGTSTIAREFAKVTANQIGLRVVLLDADRLQPTQNRYFKLSGDLSWTEAIRCGEPLDKALHRIGQSKLVVSPSSNSVGFTPEIFHSPVFDHFCEILREKFELILLDSVPFSLSPDALAIASKVDGIVIVVEAEKTKWQTVNVMKESIKRVGGNVLGVVLNKRKFYIPDYIYRHL